MTGEAALIAEGNRIKELRDDAKFLCWELWISGLNLWSFVIEPESWDQELIDIFEAEILGLLQVD